MLDQLLQYDTELFVYLNSLGSETWDGLWLVITNKWTFVPLYALILFLFYRKFGWKSLLVLVVVVALMITFTDQITNIFKRGFERFRPCACDEIKDHIRFIADRCSSNRSFFSGHAANSMAAAVFGGLIFRPVYKNAIFLLLFWAFLVAYSRIYVGVHFPLDIFCGMVFGAISGFIFFKLNTYLQQRFISS